MKQAVISLLVLAGACLAAGEAMARPPVVVELFTAQGCASCAPANSLINQLADRPGVVALTYGVDYWDYLGWSDTFAKPEFAQRQRDYIHLMGLRDVFTPQVVVNGRAQAAGVRPAVVERLVADAGREDINSPQIRVRPDGRVAVGSGPRPRGGGEVWLVRFDPRQQSVEVRQGDNRGQTVVQRNVVRQIQRLGAWSGRPVLLRAAPAAPDEGLRTLVLVQAMRDGRLVGVMLQDQPGAP